MAGKFLTADQTYRPAFLRRYKHQPLPQHRQQHRIGQRKYPADVAPFRFVRRHVAHQLQQHALLTVVYFSDFDYHIYRFGKQ